MKLLISFAFVALFVGCAATTLNKTDPSFQPNTIEGKSVIVENNSNVEFAGFLDLDAAYASGVFKDTYPVDTAYSNDFTKQFSEAFVKATGSKLIKVCDKFDRSCQDQGQDYRVTLDNLKFHNRLEVDATYSVYDRGNKKVLEIDVGSKDKISLGASGRFKEAFINLSRENAENIEKDLKTLQ